MQERGPQSELNAWIVAEMPDDQLVKRRAARFAGRIALAGVVELDDGQPYHSLLDALRALPEDDRAKQLTIANISSDVIERTLKAGHILRSVMTIAESGAIYQHGQSLQSVQANSLAQARNHPQMYARTLAENNNAFRLEDLCRWGDLLKEYSFAVFSKAKDLPECGFFTDTMSCSIQLTHQEGQQLITESAFVAGKTEDGQMIDSQSINHIYLQLAGKDVSSLSDDELIDTPLLIHNSLIPNGVVDLVRLYDQVNSTFFGLNRAPEDYLGYLSKCRDREAGYQDICQRIFEDLVAAVPQMSLPSDATRKLNQLSEQYTVEKAVHDSSIDPRVFGPVSAVHILAARQALALGLEQQYRESTQLAKDNAVSSSCPAPGEVGTDRGDDANSDQYGSLSFNCPKCRHVNTRKPNQLIPKCQRCGWDVSCKKETAPAKQAA